jgi:hypothetical protein
MLAKQLYEHALDHSRTGAAADKMIAVHNFHNAIEIVLRAILLEHEIRVERELNIDFEQMLSNIDQFPKFTEKGQRLPYRQELRKLNSVRNLVQHHAHEPEGSAMEEWRVFTRRFLTQAVSEYFGEDFDALTQLTFIADIRLQRLLALSKSGQEQLDWSGALTTSKLAFEYASSSIEDHLPHGGATPPFLGSELRTGNWDVDSAVRSNLEKLYTRIAEAERLAALLASGINLADLARYQRTPISVRLSANGTPNPFFRPFQLQSDLVPDEIRWVYSFVVSTIIRWQTVGLDPKVQEWGEIGCDTFLGDTRIDETPS